MGREPEFVHLHVHSAYSLAEGALRIEELIELCRSRDMPAVAVTDTNNLFGALEFATEAARAGIQPIIGVQIRVPNDRQLVLLAQSEQGYHNLCKLVSDAYLVSESAPDESSLPTKEISRDVFVSFEALEELGQDVICLSGGPLFGVTEEKDLLRLKDVFKGRFYIELQRHGDPREEQAEPHLIELAYRNDIPLVATNDCYFAAQKMYEAHDALLCIAQGRYVTEDDRRKVTSQHFFKSAQEMRDLFADIPEAVENSVVIARRCHFLLKDIEPILPAFDTGAGSEEQQLRQLAAQGLEWRLANFVSDDIDHKPYRDRLAFELDVIAQMGFPGYFLIVSDFIIWAKEHGIPVGPGRGSGAGSVVAWALKITDLDPLKFNLLFERFLNPERISMPDFDVDFCQDRRDEVIRYVQERYGHDRVAQIITFGKLQARAVVRDVGRVLQIPYPVVDRLAKMIPNNPANPVTLEEALLQDEDLRAERDKDDTNRKLIDIALKLEGLYRHASTHAAGVVIGDRPLHELIPLYRDPRSDMPVTQFNMKYVEQAGLVKFDFLGLKTLTVIQKTIDYVKRSGGREIDILKVPLDDKKTFEMLARGETVGVFQLESAGMRDLGKQMKISAFEQIIAMVALYRPGPMENIPKYLSCLHGQEERDYMHPKLEPVLRETYGVMIYQEQVLQAAQILAGYSLGAADLLRKAMGKKIKAVMDAEREKFVAGAKKHNNIPPAVGNEIFDQIAKFAGYGFNKAHSAGYALVSYWTAWLKANHPVEFMAASMTLDMGNTDKLSVFKQELERQGIPLVVPDINRSDVEFCVRDGSILYALAALKGVGQGAMEKLVEDRSANGPYKDLADFFTRMDPKTLNKKQLEGLICAGAFDSLEPNRALLFENSEYLLRHAAALAQERESGQSSLFGAPGEDAAGGMQDLPLLNQAEDWDPMEQLRHEFDAVGFYLSAHPLDSRQGQLEKAGVVSFARLQEKMQKQSGGRHKIAGVLIRKQEKISKSGNKYAFLQISDSSGVFEVTLFSDLLSACRDVLVPGTALLLSVDAELQDDQVRLTAQTLEDLEENMGKRLREVHVHMTGPGSASKIRELLDAEGDGAVKIKLMLETAEGQAEMSLPGRWRFSPQAISALRRRQDVSDVLEF